MYSKVKTVTINCFCNYVLLATKAPVKKVKVSFFGRHINESKPMQKADIHSPVKHTTSVVQKISEDKGKTNVTSKREKSENVGASSTVASNVTLPTSLAKDTKQRSRTNESLKSVNKEMHNKVETDTERNQSDTPTGVIQKDTQHVNKTNTQKEQNNFTEKSKGDPITSSSENSPETKLQGADIKVQGVKKQTPVELNKPAIKQSSASNKVASNKNVKDQNTKNSSMLTRNGSQDKEINKTGSGVLETLKINFLKKNRTLLSDQNNSLSHVIGPGTQNNTMLPTLHNKSNSKTNSQEKAVSSKSASAVRSDKKETSTNKEPDAQRDKQTSRSGLNENTRTQTTTSDALHNRTQTTNSAKPKKIIIKLNGQQGASKENKTNVTVNDKSVLKAINSHQVNEDTRINSQQGNVAAKIKTQTRTDAKSPQLKTESKVDNSNEQKRNSSSINVERREDRSGSLTYTSLLRDQKHLDLLKNVKGNKNKSDTALDSSKVNETNAKANVHIKNIKKKDVSISERDYNDSINGEQATLGSELVKKAPDKNTGHSVVQLKNRAHKKQNAKGLGNSVDDISGTTKKETRESVATVTRDASQQKIVATSQKLERLNNSQGTTQKVKEEKTKKNRAGSHDEMQKGML